MTDQPPGRPTGRSAAVPRPGARPTGRLRAAATTAPAPGATTAEALRLSRAGTELFQRGQYLQASDAFAKAYHMFPGFSGFASNLGAALIAQDRFEEALNVLGRGHEVELHDPRLRVNLGIAAAQQGHQDQAMWQWQMAVTQDSTLKEPHANLALAFLERDEPVRAVESARTAVALAPDWPEGHFLLGCALSAQGSVREEVVSYQEAIRLRPGYADALNNLGAALRQLREHFRAADAFGQLATLVPNDPQPLVDRGICQWFARDREVAVATLDSALSIQPGYLPALTTSAIFHAQLGHAEQATAATAHAVQLYPKAAEVYMAQGLVHELANDFSASLAAYDQALALAPALNDALLHRADVLCALGRRQEAIRVYRDLLNKDWEVPDVHLSLADALLAEGQRDAARESAIRAADVQTSDTRSLQRLGKVLVELALTDRAEDIFEQLLRLDPGDRYAATAIGQIKVQQNNLDAAVEYFEKAFRADPTYARASYNLALVHYSRGAYDLVRRVLELTIQAHPDHLKARSLLGKSLLKAGEPELAQKAFEEALALKPKSVSMLAALVKIATDRGDKQTLKTYYPRLMALKEEQAREAAAGAPSRDEDEDPALPAD